MVIELEPPITTRQLARALQKAPAEIEKSLHSMGRYTTDGDRLKIEQAVWIIEQEGFRIKVSTRGKEDILSIEPGPKKILENRPPVVTVMGHVDHGKTVLLDAIRHTNLAAREPGAITQHIGAYKIHVPGGDIVFLDTPGHEAFVSMRARGALITDIVVLVVAADDGVKAQTLEAVQHARAAHVPILVAVNKIDKPGANPQRVREQLAGHGLIPEEWQGETIYVDISAKFQKNLDHLLEMILLLAEILELKADPGRMARGTVVESRLDRHLGSLATVLIQDGTIQVKDSFVCGQTYGRVRFMMNEYGRQVTSAPPSTPVQISSFSEMPKAGDPFFQLSDERDARKLSELIAKQYEVVSGFGFKRKPVDLKAYQQEIEKGKIPVLFLVVKVDVFGSLQPIVQSIKNLQVPGARIEIIHHGVGPISESDVLLASASHGMVIGFNVKPDPKATRLAQQERVEIRLYNLIYELMDEMARAAQGLVVPQYREEIVGQGEIIKVFHIPQVGTVAGCLVQRGKFFKGYQARIIHRGIVLYTGKIASLKHYDEFVDEIGEGNTCGILLTGKFTRFHLHDQVEVFTREEISPPSS
ncbi:MAG: translation initiation factor IF-2 [bacterium]